MNINHLKYIPSSIPIFSFSESYFQNCSIKTNSFLFEASITFHIWLQTEPTGIHSEVIKTPAL